MTARLVTAAIGLPVLALAIWFGAAWFSALVAAAAGLGALEFCQLGERWRRRPIPALSTVWAVALVAGAYLVSSGDSGAEVLLVVGGASVAILLWVVVRIRPKASVADWAVTLGAVMYSGGLLAHAPLLRGLEDGREWVFIVVLVTFATDTAAFFFGRSLGRTPLAPRVSPGKTWEGAAAGLVAATVAAPVLAGVFGLDVAVPGAVTLGVLMGVAGQAGDLLESKFKRAAGVKDSGWVLPGHGGVLDRLDSIVFNIVLVYHFVMWSAS